MEDEPVVYHVLCGGDLCCGEGGPGSGDVMIHMVMVNPHIPYNEDVVTITRGTK